MHIYIYLQPSQYFLTVDLPQVESLRHQCELKEMELQKSTKKAQEAMAVAAEEAAKCKAAKEVIKSLTAQVKFDILLVLKENLKSAFFFSGCCAISFSLLPKFLLIF